MSEFHWSAETVGILAFVSAFVINKGFDTLLFFFQKSKSNDDALKVKQESVVFENVIAIAKVEKKLDSIMEKLERFDRHMDRLFEKTTETSEKVARLEAISTVVQKTE